MELRYLLAVVTGAGAGLGREIAIALSRAGAAVLVVDRDLDTAEETASMVRRARVHAWALRADLTLESDVRLVADRARDLGGADLLVNNAGGWMPGEQYPAAPYETWSRALALNLTAPMQLTQLVLAEAANRPDRRPGTPAVVNVASSAALGPTPYASPEYAAAKAGLVRLTSALADPEAAGGRVTAVVPGWIGLPRAEREWSELTEAERAGLPSLIPPAEVTRTVLDLLSRGEPGTVVEILGED
ncbi:MAG TPA: SDR family oxidoreductase [Nocardioides sp.]|nr:SDR family oxidoreductase [Nocardioides sp.]